MGEPALVELGRILNSGATIAQVTDDSIRLALSKAEIEHTMEGPSVLTLGVVDPDQWLLRQSGLLTKANWGRLSINVAGVNYVQAELDRTQDGVEIAFYVAGAAKLKAIKHKPFALTRGKWTRADMLAEICYKARLPFNRPDTLGDGWFVKQPIEGFSRDELRELAAAESSQISQNFERGFRSRGVLNGKGIKIKGVKATRDQLRNLETLLRVADEQGAEGNARLALIVAAIGESAVKAVPNSQGSPYGGVLQGKYRADANGPANFDISDTAGMAESFLKGGKGFQRGGAIYLAKHYPQYSPGDIAIRVEGGISNFGGDYVAAAQFYDQHQDEAMKVLRVWAGADKDTSLEDLSPRTGTPDRARIDTYQFRVENSESYYEAADRLAEEVNWRFWVQGNDLNHPDGLVWFSSDPLLARATPTLVFGADSAGVDSITWSADASGEIDEMSVAARMTYWTAAPGQVVVIEGEGDVANGRWLVRSVMEDLLDRSLTASITLGRPQDPLLEPKATITTIAGTSPIDNPSESTGTEHGRKFKQQTLVANLVKKMDQIASQGLPYSWGGGHNSQFVPSPGTTHSYGGPIVTGYDCSGAVSAVLHSVDLLANPATSGDLAAWALPGEGDYITVWANATHVFFIVKFPDGTTKLWEASPPDGGAWRPMRSTSGYTARHADGM